MKKLILFLSIALLAGCTTPSNLIGPVVNGIVMWKQGEAQKYYAYDASIVCKAMDKSLRDLGIPHEITTNGVNDFQIITDSDKKFNIKIHNVKDGISVLKIRVGFMGDKPYAEMVYSKVDQNISCIEYKKPQKVNRKTFRDRKNSIR